MIELDLDGPVAPLAFAVHAAADGSLLLTPPDATLLGPSLRVEQVGAVGDVRYNPGYWLDTGATATWPRQVARDGDYVVEIELACADAAAGSKMELVCGSANVTFEVPATGGWQSYRTVKLGTMAPRTGPAACVLRATTKPGEAALNGRSIRLSPSGLGPR